MTTTSAIPPVSTVTPATTAPGSDRAKLHQAAQSFEAIFVREMLSTARSTTFGDDLWGSDQGNETFAAMRDERFAEIAAQSGTLGLGKQVESQLAPLVPTASAPGTGKTG